MSESDMLAYIISRESGGNPWAVSASGTYCGIGQLSRNKYPYYVGMSWEECAGNYDIQLQAMLAYIENRYGSIEAAYEHTRQKGWY
jgi:SLT domain-containing protein